MFKMKDSRGKPSLTLGFVTTAFLTVTVAFIYSTYFSHEAELASYGTAVMTILAPFIAREYKEKSDVGS